MMFLWGDLLSIIIVHRLPRQGEKGELLEEVELATKENATGVRT